MTILRNAMAATALIASSIACAGVSTAGETKALNVAAAAPITGQPVPVALNPAKLPENTSPGLAASSPATGERQSFAPMALNSLTNPPAQIATAQAVDIRGTPVGAVQKVELDANGKPSQVQIALLGSNRVVALTP